MLIKYIWTFHCNTMKCLWMICTCIGISSAYSLPPLKSHEIDRKIWNVAKPATINYIMVPVVGMVDTFWVSKKGSVQELAAVGSADQIFFAFYSVLSFLPIVLTPKISRLHTKDKKEDICNVASISIYFTIFLSLFGFILTLRPENVASLFLDTDSCIYHDAIRYLKYRSISMPFCLFNSVVFSIMRGMFDYSTALKVNLFAQLLNMILDPIFIHHCGVIGAAMATVLSDSLCSICYIHMLYSKQLFRRHVVYVRRTLSEFIRIGSTIQMRMLLLQSLYVFMNRKIISMDTRGVNMASHIILSKILSITSIFYCGLSMTSSSILSSEIIMRRDKKTRDRILGWTSLVAILQSIFLAHVFPYVKYMSKDTDVIETTRSLLSIVCLYQCVDGYHSVLEGMLQGYQKFILPSTISFLTYLPMFSLIHVSLSLHQIWRYIFIFVALKCIIFYKILPKIKEDQMAT